MSFSASRPVIDLVTALMAEGCEMWSLGDRYSIEEPTEKLHATKARLILARFGPRDHLRAEISRHLTEIGRSFDRPI